MTAFQNCAPSANFSSTPADSTDQASSVPTTPTAPTPTPAPTVSKGILRGTITNALNDNPISGATVKIRKASAPGTVVASVTTDASGNYSASNLDPAAYLVDMSASGFITLSDLSTSITSGQTTTLNKSLSPALASDQIRIVLNWCSSKSGAVEDIDAYLATPDGDFVYYHDKTANGAKLDIDVRHWKGPETVTISSIKAGTYVYYVNNYNLRGNATALGNSEIRVTVYKGSSVLKNYSVPVGSGITYELFRIVDGAIVDTMKYTTALPYAQ